MISSVKGFLKTIYQGWLKVAHLIGKVNTTIVLILFYFTFVGVARLATLLLKKDLLGERWKKGASYWKKREELRTDREAWLKPY